MGVVENLLDGSFSELKDDIEQRVAIRLADRIKEKKVEIINNINENKE